MGLSRLEKYLTVIKVLESWDSITQKQIICKADLNLALTKEYLNFLVKMDLIVEKKLENKIVYSITERGQKLCTYFRLNDDYSIFDGIKIARID